MEIPKYELERLARFLLPRILEFYENEEKLKAFDEWIEQQRKHKSNTSGEIGMEEQLDRD